MRRTLSDSFCLRILEEYFSSDISKHAIGKKYSICPKCIPRWLRKFGLEDKPQVTMSEKDPNNSTLSVSEREELARLRQENRALKARLKRESLGHEAYKLLVELAEETYGIEIRKNSEAK